MNWKKILSWVIAIIVSIVVIRMAFRILFVGMVMAFELTKMIFFAIPVILLAIPLYMIIKKKFLK